MKLKKVLGNILTGLGCVIMLIGLAAFLLPKIDNRQLKLVLSTFQTPSDNWLIQLMNNGMNFAMEHCFLMLLIGSAIMLVGVLLNISARTDEEAHARRNTRKATATSTAYQRNARPQPVAKGGQAAPDRPAEDNPFARYMADGNLPKSTIARTSTHWTAPQATKPQQHNSAEEAQKDVLNLWNQIQQQSEDPEDLYIQPVYVTDDQAYRRPAEANEPPRPAAAIPELIKVAEVPAFYAFEEGPAEPDTATPEPTVNDNPDPAVLPEPVSTPVPVSIPVPETTPAQPASDGPRPVIRSTFRKSTEVQPLAPPVAPVESAPAAPTLQPTSRIKSTIGRKR